MAMARTHAAVPCEVRSLFKDMAISTRQEHTEMIECKLNTFSHTHLLKHGEAIITRADVSIDYLLYVIK